ncbi:hypothetical protein [Leptospira interrogans]|uniref:hypothetical protein n=1 Tax=Leptospira interrogans TaxID=173 RepID=UPI0007741F90|nr:hypothetical protein [Leptospira interrogans]
MEIQASNHLSIYYNFGFIKVQNRIDVVCIFKTKELKERMQLLEIRNNESKILIAIYEYYDFLKLYYYRYNTQPFEVA